MGDRTLNRYLAKAGQAGMSGPLDCAVLGNEAADLDSMVSALAWAFHRSALGDGQVIVPVMPLARADFRLRTEAVHLFKRAGVDPAALMFLDDDPGRPGPLDRAKSLTLVDHNRLAGPFRHLGQKVAAILDHHQDEGLYPGADPRIIAPVGSTATLVTHQIMAHGRAPADPCLALLLLGTILLDTVNLDLSAGRTTARDETAATWLMTQCETRQTALFESIRAARFDTSGLSTADLLQKDYKAIQAGNTMIGIASVPLSLADWGRRDPDLGPAFDAFARTRSLDILLVMSAYAHDGFHRDLAVLTRDKAAHLTCLAFLRNQGLDLSPLFLGDLFSGPADRLSLFRQGNTEISRKRLTPFLKRLSGS